MIQQTARFFKLSTLFFIGGLLYYLLEITWRGYSHWTMAIVGGFCFVLVGSINNLYGKTISLTKQALMAALIITFVEFISGLIINLWLQMNVWDYSYLPLDILGQVCLPFTIIWLFLSVPVIILDDYLRLWLFGEEKPDYRIL